MYLLSSHLQMGGYSTGDPVLNLGHAWLYTFNIYMDKAPELFMILFCYVQKLCFFAREISAVSLTLLFITLLLITYVSI